MIDIYYGYEGIPSSLRLFIDSRWNSNTCDTIFNKETKSPIGLITIEKESKIKWINDERPNWLTDEKLRELPAKYWLDKESVKHLINKG